VKNIVQASARNEQANNKISPQRYAVTKVLR
jgi:hypothetical protein